MDMAHVHLWLTYVPILGSIFLTVLFLVSLVYRNGFTQKVSLWFLGGIALVTIPMFFSGEAAEEAVEDLPGVSKAMIDLHEFVSRFGFGVMCVTGIIALGGVFLFRNRPTSLALWLRRCLRSSLSTLHCLPLSAFWEDKSTIRRSELMPGRAFLIDHA